MNALEPLFPALRSLEPLGLAPSSLGGWFAYANAQQSARLAAHLEREFSLIGLECPEAVDHVYLRSDAFRANVVQAVRAAEVAESDGKLRLIARALAGCLLVFPAPALDKFQTMRLVEQLSERELNVFATLMNTLDPVDPLAGVLPLGASLPGFSREEGLAALLGLAGLGLLRLEGMGLEGGEWRFTPLARQVALLGRLVVTHDF